MECYYGDSVVIWDDLNESWDVKYLKIDTVLEIFLSWNALTLSLHTVPLMIFSCSLPSRAGELIKIMIYKNTSVDYQIVKRNQKISWQPRY